MLVNDLDLRITLGGSTFYSWKLDRNSPESAATNNSENDVDNVEVVYIAAPTAGDYTVTVDHDGSLSGGSQDFSIIYDGIYEEIIPTPPIANFSSSDPNIMEGQTISYTDKSANNPTSWNWTFEGGDPSTSTDRNPVITYNSISTFDVSLTVDNITNTPSTKTVENYANVGEFILSYCTSHGNAINEWIADVTIGYESMTYGSSGVSGYQDLTGVSSFNLESGSTNIISLSPDFDPRSKFEYWSVWIDFNVDGDFEDLGEQVFSASKSKTSVSGNITIPTGPTIETRMRVSMSRSGVPESCEIFDLGEVKDYTVQIGEPISQLPVANFSANKTTIELGESVQFTDLSDNPTSWLWSFPEGTPSTSTSQNPLITYDIAGTHDVSLTVTNAGVSDQEIKLGYITVNAAVPQPPVADFSADITNIIVGESVQFTDLSTNNPTSWSWNFGNGQTSLLQNPSVTYNSAETFDVSLTAVNDDGYDTQTKTGYIIVSEPSGEYCPSSGLSTSLEWIQSVTIDGLSNNSGDNLGYGDYSNTEFNLPPGSNLPITLTPGFSDKSQREFWRVWIDFNGNYIFEDPEELVLAVNNTKSTVSGNISIPTTGLIGPTRMRISMKQGSAPLACEIFNRGEVEDYTVTFNITSNKSATIQPNISVDINSEVSFNAYPNPATDKLNVYFNGWDGRKEIRLFDMTGKAIYLKTTSAKIFEIDVSAYPKGIYLLDVNNGIYRENKKISIQ